MASPSKLFNKLQKEQIVNTIIRAEKATSAEIRVHFENHCKGMVLDRAVQMFDKLKMSNTADRNGILIYVALKDRVTAIIGDVNINRHVDKNFWQDCYQVMTEYFKKEDFVKGVCTAIELIELELKPHFPHQTNDIDELPNDLSFG